MRPSHLVPILLALGVAAAALPAQPWATPVPPTLDAATRRLVVDSVARVLAARYVDPEVAARLAARVRQRLDTGAYDAFREPAPFGAALMHDLQQVAADKHLRISWEPERDHALGGGGPVGGGRAAQAGASPAGAPPGVVRQGAGGGPVPWRRIDPRDSATIARTNFAFQRVERFAGNVGYVKFDQFVPLDYSRETAVAAMSFLAGSDAVIIDLRDNVGGSPDLVELVASYFLPPEPAVLLRTYFRATGETMERRSLRELPGRRLGDVPLYILTSGNSASAAEMLPYALQRLGRATVVGERTAGAGNGGAKVSVGAGLALFVPQMRIVSGPGYERTGVAPDVAVPADSALVVARRLAAERLAALEAAPDVARERAWALELLRAEARPAPSRATLARYVGRYGTTLLRTVRVEGDRLVTVGSVGWADRLLAVDDVTFRSADARYRFETDATGQVTALVVEAMNGRTTRLPRVPTA